MAALINRIGDLCMERSTVKEDGSLTDAQPIQPSELLKIIAGDFS
jgi:hypothetical protein